FFQAEDGIRDFHVTGVQTCALPIFTASAYGSQIAAELTLTKDGVACDYQVIGMWPWVDCGSPAPDNPEAMVPDDAACSPEPDERSEEHTSELQSRENLVCRLLLEKK